ncbi:FUSC family protein [Granulicoccus phenolivorans]|uniref:FUSC family protein n=1 Tax=Granulicoccus phenolivorans TaxID=266854 RepID=UPI0004089F3E|nr:FUSC family protein [Granulicoccus phenolivorans]
MEMPDRARMRALRLRAFDMSENAARAGWARHGQGMERWKQRLFLICQVSISAGVAWWMAQTFLGHKYPFLATVSVILCLGLSYGQRVTRVISVAIGVFIGVMVGDLIAHFFGAGPWQIMMVCFLAMSIATWAHSQTLMINQAGIQAATVLTLMPALGESFSRWQDALLGCGLALLVTMVAPTSPVQKPRVKAAAVLAGCARTVTMVRDALVAHDEDAAMEALERARATQGSLTQLSQAAAEGVQVVRYSPFLRGHKENAQAIAELVVPLDRMVRNLRVLARRAAVATWRHEDVPQDYLDSLTELADIIDFCATEMKARRIPTQARERILALAESSAHLGVHGSLSGVVIYAQIRSMLVDLLELTGLDPAESRELLPEVDAD